MSLADRLFGPIRITDAELGPLRYSTRRWTGRTPDGLSFAIASTRRRLDAELRSALIEALGRLSDLERVARAYLAADSRASKLKIDRLIGVSVGRALSGWISTTLVADPNRASTAVRPNDVITSVEFGVVDDPNVLEVVFKDGEPITSDYH